MQSITGTLLNYFMICPRKMWLHKNNILMEQESESVALGRLLDESSYKKSDKQILLHAEAPGGISLVGKIDRSNLKQGVLHETKKGRACEDSHQWQLRFYLWLLKLNGVSRSDGSPFTGQLDYPALRKSEVVTLTETNEQQLQSTVEELAKIFKQPIPPPRLSRRSFCRKCAFEELCYG